MTWRHLNFFQHQAYLNARVPRVRCDTCGVKTANVPWARPDSGFTLLFEALVMTMVSAMPVKAVAWIVGEHDTRLWRVVHHYVDQARAGTDASGVTRLAIDETAARRGHDYVTLFVDIEQAVNAFRDALLEFMRERVPLDWAATQNNLGSALQTFGQRETDKARLEQAVNAFRDALLEFTRERGPLQWATTQNNLGDALAMLGLRETDKAQLEQAAAAWDACLTVTASVWPSEWVDAVRSKRDKAQADIARRSATP